MNNEWKKLDINNLPGDILVGDYEFEYFSESLNTWMKAGRFETDNEMRVWLINGLLLKHLKYRYRRKQKPAPSHKEIMTKWWELGGLWMRVITYEPREPKPYKLYSFNSYVDKEFFIGLESADIPPEADR